MKSTVLVLLFLLLSPYAEPEIKLTVRPLIQSAPGEVRIEYRISRHPDNREYEISWSDEAGKLGSHRSSLDGDNEPALFPSIYLEDLGPGQYVTEGVVKRIVGGKIKEYKTRQPFEVLR